MPNSATMNRVMVFPPMVRQVPRISRAWSWSWRLAASNASRIAT
jgi:hypothetical protein